MNTYNPRMEEPVLSYSSKCVAIFKFLPVVPSTCASNSVLAPEGSSLRFIRVEGIEACHLSSRHSIPWVMLGRWPNLVLTSLWYWITHSNAFLSSSLWKEIFLPRGTVLTWASNDKRWWYNLEVDIASSSSVGLDRIFLTPIPPPMPSNTVSIFLLKEQMWTWSQGEGRLRMVL